MPRMTLAFTNRVPTVKVATYAEDGSNSADVLDFIKAIHGPDSASKRTEDNVIINPVCAVNPGDGLEETDDTAGFRVIPADQLDTYVEV